MQLNCLCLVLPGLAHHEVEPFDHHHSESLAKKDSHRRECGSQVLDFLGHSLRRLYDSRWKCFHIHDQHESIHSSKWVCFCHRDKSTKKETSLFYDLEGIQITEKVGADKQRIFGYSELYIGSNGFSEDLLLGAGGFGKVYKAILPSDGTVVAVKCLAEKGERFEKTFAAELVAVAHLRHRNLVRLRGWCVHEDQLFLVYDYMPNLSLDRVLFRRLENSGAAPLSWKQREKIICGLAAALFYLHEQLENQIIHRDVKTSNVMLDSQFNARLGDFGLARWLEHELEYLQEKTPSVNNNQFRLTDSTRIGGTIGYLPPESFQKGKVATAKSDVFSFGVVVLEVVSGRRAVDLTFSDDKIILLDWIRGLSDQDRLLEVVDTRLTDVSSAGVLIHLGLLCTLQNPQLRPNMKWVVEVLSGQISGNFPSLPSFQGHPQYISVSSSTNTSPSKITTSTVERTITYASSNYYTASEETIYESCSFDSSHRRSSSSFVVEAPREISYKEIISATDHFSVAQRVAELDFGTAYHGFLDDNHDVLVKRLGMTSCPALQTRFSNELENLARLRHRNLVQLRGWCKEHGEMLLVYDYSAKRMLNHLLYDHNNKNPVLQWCHRYKIIKSLANAILYLHEENVIHRNITSSAIMLEPDMNPRLTSFALAEFLTINDHDHDASSDITRSVRGIFGYMSPEYMESGEATTVADVYSFGVVVLEMVTGQMAVDFRRPESLLVMKVQNFESQGRPLEDLVDLRLNGEFQHKELIRIVKLGVVCTRSDPRFRPNMRQIVSILDGNDKVFPEAGKKEGRAKWRERYADSLSLIRRMQALGIQ